LASIAALAVVLSAPVTALASDAVEVYKTPQCGCCDKWVDHMRANGFTVNVNVVARTDAYRAKAGVATSLASCHTALVGGYVVEGHVPASNIKRLLAQRPSAKGLVVPQMPQTSPGMDALHGEAWDVFLLGTDGSLKVFASYPAK
jgi:hypothetical protein